MIRSTSLAAAVTGFALLAGCGNPPAEGDRTAGRPGENIVENVTVEDLPSDGLAAPADTPIDSESNGGGNAV